MTVGWSVSYMAWFNLYMKFNPWFWAPAIGGLLAAVGAFLISRELKSDIETAKPLA